jgi:outer membrane protein
MRMPTLISENQRAILRIFIPLAFGAVSVSSRGQTNPSIADCSTILSTRDAARCIGAVRPAAPIPVLDIHHIYTLPELIDIAEMASPEGRIAWATAKRAMERTGIDHALYLPILTFVAQGSDARFIVPFPEPIAPIGYVTVEEPIAAAQLQFEYDLLDFGRGPKLDGSKALEIASTLRLGRVHQTLAFGTATQFYRAQRRCWRMRSRNSIMDAPRSRTLRTRAPGPQRRATTLHPPRER